MRTLFLALFALLVSAFAVGCSSGSDSGTQDQASVPQGLTVGVGQVPETLDPGQNFLRQPYAIMQLISGTLMEPDPDGKGVHSGLAESLEAGNLEYTVLLRPGLKFSDGSKLTSADVVASFDYYMGDETNGYSYTFEPIKKVRAEDERTVVFELNRPYPSLPFILTLPTSAILPAGALEGKEPYAGDPLPTAGPYTVSSFDRNAIALQYNAAYWGDPKEVTSLTFKKISDPAARLTQVQGGEIDFADGISLKQVAQISPPVEVRRTVAVNGVTLIVMNNRDNSPLSDVRIRKAIALVLDRDQINEIAYAGQNEPVLGLWGNDSRWSEPFLPETPDLEAAEKLLVGTACEDGCELKMQARTDDEPLGDIAIPVEQALQEIGIDVQIEKLDGSTAEERASEGNFDLRATFSYDVGEFPDGYLAFTLGPAIEGLYSGYSSEQMNALIELANESGGAERDEAIKQINELFEKDLPMVPIEGVVVVSASRVPEEAFNVETTLYYHVG